MSIVSDLVFKYLSEEVRLSRLITNKCLLTLQVQQAKAILAQRQRAYTGHGISLLRPSVFRI